MRVAVIIRVFVKSAGGAESYCVNLVEQLALRHEVHVFAQQFGPQLPGVVYHRIFCLHPRPRWINQWLFAVASWWQTRRGFAVVHAHENTWHGEIQTIHVGTVRRNLLPLAASRRLRLWAWLKIALSPRLLSYIWLEQARFKVDARRCIVATSNNLRADCAQNYPHSCASLSVITPGVQMPAQKPAMAQARRQLGLPVDVALLLFVANDYARKGLSTLLQALARLPAKVHLAVVGKAQSIDTYRLQAQQLGVLERIHFLGPLEAMTLAYSSADCLAHPTLEDSFAMVVLEAMASGLPVVVSGPEHCGIASYLQDGQQALLLANPLDAVQLASLLQAVLTRPDLAQQLAQNGLAFARQQSWQHVAWQYEALYQKLQSKTRKPPQADLLPS